METPQPGTDPSESARSVELARAGDVAAIDGLFARHRSRLRRVVDLRLDRRLLDRVDSSDVVQDGFADAVAKILDYLSDPKVPLFLWLRLVVGSGSRRSTARIWAPGYGSRRSRRSGRRAI